MIIFKFIRKSDFISLKGSWILLLTLGRIFYESRKIVAVSYIYFRLLKVYLKGVNILILNLTWFLSTDVPIKQPILTRLFRLFDNIIINLIIFKRLNWLLIIIINRLCAVAIIFLRCKWFLWALLYQLVVTQFIEHGIV